MKGVGGKPRHEEEEMKGSPGEEQKEAEAEQKGKCLSGVLGGQGYFYLSYEGLHRCHCFHFKSTCSRADATFSKAPATRRQPPVEQ